jgi:hypothetical protein
MANVPQWVADKVNGNTLELALERDSTDPFRDETRKAKRNLVAAGFIAVAVASLGVSITGFAGVAITKVSDAAQITNGLACLAVIYFLLTYFVDSFLDYASWRQRLMRLEIVPYLMVARLVERSFRNSSGQLKNVAWQFNHHLQVSPSTPQASALTEKNLKSALGQIEAIEKHQQEMITEIRPLLLKWERTLRSLRFLAGWRTAARGFRIWIWDLCVPIGLGVLAICKTQAGLWFVIPKLLW